MLSDQPPPPHDNPNHNTTNDRDVKAEDALPSWMTAANEAGSKPSYPPPLTATETREMSEEHQAGMLPLPPPMFAENNEKLRSPVKTSQPITFPQAIPVPQPEAMVTMGMTMEQYQQQRADGNVLSQPSGGPMARGATGDPAEPVKTTEMRDEPTVMFTTPPPIFHVTPSVPTAWHASCLHPCADPRSCFDAMLCPCCLSAAHYDALFHEHRVQNANARNCNCPVAGGLCCLTCLVGGLPMGLTIKSSAISCVCSAWACLPVVSIATFFFRRMIRKRFNIHGHFSEPPVHQSGLQTCWEGTLDLFCSCFCLCCTLSQHHRELVHRGGYRGRVVFSRSDTIPLIQ